MGVGPQTTSVVQRRDLTQVAQEFDAENVQNVLFKADKMAAPFPVEEVIGRYPVWNRENFKKPPTNNRRAEDGGYVRVDAAFNQLTFATEEFGLEQRVDDRNAARWSTWIDLEQRAARQLRYLMLQQREFRVKTLFETTMGLTNANVATAWTDLDDSDPFTDILTAARLIENKAGIPRALLSLAIPTVDFDEMMATDRVRGTFNSTYLRSAGIQPQLLSTNDVAGQLGFKEVFKLASYYDSGEEGQSETDSAIWTPGVMYIGIFADAGQDLEAMSAARTMVFSRDGGEDVPIMERYRDDVKRSEVLRSREDLDEVATAEADLFVRKLTNT